MAPASAAAAAATPILLTIPFSHYNERARWALDLAGIPRRELRFLPGFHVPGVSFACWWYGVPGQGSADGVSSPFSTPMLVRPGDNFSPPRALRDSLDIVRYADEVAGLSLFPPCGSKEAAEVDELCALFHDVLGPAARAYGYSSVLYNVRQYCSTGWYNANLLQSSLWILLGPAIALGLRSGIGADDRPRAEADIRKSMDIASQKLSDGRPFLVGDRMTVADLSLASLGSIAIGLSAEEGYGGGKCYLPPSESFPAEMRSFYEEMRATRAGQHILKMYRDHRKAKA
ncbi:hypothetical protein DFJ74DRAFT_697229 [Hyaloraphidium curvatum]|nr:hypothetical protein DFJ74DRAFT_697229 [Hyaloraphidium curvatum]